jgi:hypothetical protein
MTQLVLYSIIVIDFRLEFINDYQSVLYPKLSRIIFDHEQHLKMELILESKFTKDSLQV